MTTSWSRRAKSGNRKIRRDRKNHGKANQKSKSFWWFFLTAMESCTMNLHLRVRLSTHLLHGGFEASERSCALHATGIVGGEAMDSPQRQCPRALCINRGWVFDSQFHHRARTSPLLTEFSPLRLFLVPNANWCCGGGIWGMWWRLKMKQHCCWRA